MVAGLEGAEMTSHHAPDPLDLGVAQGVEGGATTPTVLSSVAAAGTQGQEADRSRPGATTGPPFPCSKRYPAVAELLPAETTMGLETRYDDSGGRR